MSKRKNLIEFDPKILNPLPSLNRFSRAIHSPKLSPKPQSPNSLIESRFERRDKLDRSEGLFIKKLDDFGKKKSKEINSSSPLLSKLETVSILEKDIEISDEEPEFSIPKKPSKDYFSSTLSSMSKKVELEIKRDQNKKNFKDIEVATLKQQNEECHTYIDSLLSEINNLKVKLKNLEENSERVQHNWQVSENSIKIMQNIIHNSDTKLKEAQNEVKFKEVELSEIKELLKKSEDKRKVANEQMINVESKLVIFQRQITKLNSNIAELNKEIFKYKEQIFEKDELIEELYNKISALEKEIELEKARAAHETIDYEQNRRVMFSKIEELESRLESSEAESKRFQDNFVKSQQDLKKITNVSTGIKRADTSVENRILSNLSTEEASRWHSRYFALEQEVSSLKQSLEKYQKNDSYFKSQLSQKNLMIQNLEETIQSIESSSQNQSTQIKSPLINSTIDIISNRIKKFKDSFRCEVCGQFVASPYITTPCCHLFCLACSDFNDKMCSVCALKGICMISLPVINQSYELANIVQEELQRLIEVL